MNSVLRVTGVLRSEAECLLQSVFSVHNPVLTSVTTFPMIHKVLAQSLILSFVFFFSVTVYILIIIAFILFFIIPLGCMFCFVFIFIIFQIIRSNWMSNHWTSWNHNMILIFKLEERSSLCSTKRGGSRRTKNLGSK